MPLPYAIPVRLALQAGAAVLRGKPRRFREDAVRWIGYLQPELELRGEEYIPQSGPFLLTVNHFSRPGFNASWIALAASACIPVDIHWTITAAWTFPGRPLRRPLRALSQAALSRIAAVYGFTSMPPMPPDPGEVEKRAQAVSQVLSYARRTPQPAIGLAPEGRDAPGGALGAPPPGLGRFVALLAPLCRQIVPAGFYEEDAHLCLQFGQPYRLDIPRGLERAQRDHQASQAVMLAIARQLPVHLRGEYQ